MAGDEFANELLAGHTHFEHAIGNLHLDHDLAFRFLVEFARFEFALKAARFVYQGENERNLEVDFDCFARTIAEPFRKKLDGGDTELCEARDYYRDAPPQKQIWNGYGPDWAEALPQNRTESAFLLILLRRTRNNLFHGGKGWKRPDGTIERDNELLRHGLQIMEAMIDCSSDVSLEFTTFA